jgi:hypothetical protein
MLRFETLIRLILCGVGEVLGTKKALIGRLLNNQVVWQDDYKVWRNNKDYEWKSGART